MPGGDPYFANVVLLMHFDGDYTDKSQYAQAFTSVGATLSATGAKFTQSVKINAPSGGGGTNAVNSDSSISGYELTPGDYTVEAWAKISSSLETGVQSGILSINQPGFGVTRGGILLSFAGRAAGNVIRFAYGASFSSIIMTSEAASVYATNGIWYHIAVTRSSDTYRLFVNGVLVATVVSSDTYPQNARYVAVGNNYGFTSGLDGYVDEVRVTKGVARYTANFTPPAAPFQNS